MNDMIETNNEEVVETTVATEDNGTDMNEGTDMTEEGTEEVSAE